MKRRRAEPFAPYRSIRRAVPKRRLVAPPRTGGFRGQTAPFRRITAERKVIDVNTATYNCNTTGSVTLLNGVAVGSDYTDRVGRKIRMKSVYVRGIVGHESIPTSGFSNQEICRMLIVYDTQTNGSVPALTDILKEATSLSQLNLNNRDRFKVLVDKQYSVAPYLTIQADAIAVSGSPTNYSVKKYKKLNHEVIFNGTASTVGSIATGALWMVWVGSTSADAGDPHASVSVRVRFEDA